MAVRKGFDVGRERWQALRLVLADQRTGPALVRRNAADPSPASFAQRRFWILEVLDPGTSAHVLAVAHDITGPLDVSVFERALIDVVARHDILRTTFSEDSGEVRQVVHAHLPAEWRTHDLSTRSAEAQNEELLALTAAAAQTPFDLESGPLVRAALIRLSDAAHRLLFSVHHAVFDGWSFHLFMSELCEIYAARSAGRASSLPEVSLHYADVAAWQTARLAGPSRNRLLDYWRNVFREPAPALTLAQRESRSSRRGPEARCEILFTEDATRRIASLAAKEGVTLFVTLLAGFQILAHRLSGETDVVIGSPVAGRNRLELTGMMGPFVNTVLFRVDLSGIPSGREVLGRVNAAVSGGLAHQELPFDLLVEAINPPRLAAGPALTSLLFALQNLPNSAWRFPGLMTTSRPLTGQTAACDLALFMQHTSSGLAAALHYDSSRFDATEADRLLRRLELLLDGMASAPEESIGRLPMLLARERTEILSLAKGRSLPEPHCRSIGETFSARASENPPAIAVRADEDVSLTYDALDAQSSAFAGRLRAAGVRPGTRVGIYLPRRPSLIIAILAVVKAGAAYVPISADAPGERIATMMTSVGARDVVTDADGAGRVGVSQLRAIVLDETEIRDEPPTPLEPVPNIDRSDIACVLFTSGSTGAPKPTGVTHGGILNLVRALGDATPQRRDVLLQLASVEFDAFTFEVWGALLDGAAVALAADVTSDPHDIARALRKHEVSLLFMTAGLFEVCADVKPDMFQSVTRLLVGGDVVSPAHAARLLAGAPQCRLFNAYGPTEATTFASIHEITPQDAAGEILPIGTPIANTAIYVLDESRELLPVGTPGEAWISGAGVVDGYIDERGRDRFTDDPFDPASRQRMYRTGDRVRQRIDGTLEFIGRVDDEVKIRGVRVNTAMIEGALLASPGVVQAAAVVTGSSAATKRLEAWVVRAAADRPRRDLREALRQSLPELMVPSVVHEVDRLPLTTRGKVNRRFLAEAAVDSVDTTGRRPETSVERELAGLFEETLRRTDVCMDDNFFELGGHSLLAIKLFHRLQIRYARTPSLSAFFAAPTVASLARWLSSQGDQRDADHDGLVALNNASDARPVFWVPGGRGGLTELALYSRALAEAPIANRIYALRTRGMDGSEPLPESVDEFARGFVQVIRRRQPRGPYRLVGECVGAAIAFEIARELRASGETVTALTLLDGWCPSNAGRRHYEWVERPRAILRDGRNAVRLDYPEDFAAADRNDAAAGTNPIKRLRRRAGRLKWAALQRTRRLLDLTSPQPGQTRAAERAYVRAAMRYRPRVFDGPVTLVATDESIRAGIADGWRPWAGGGLFVHAVPGTHASYLVDHASVTMAHLARSLEKQHS